jgi:hypothetical protein
MSMTGVGIIARRGRKSMLLREQMAYECIIDRLSMTGVRIIAQRKRNDGLLRSGWRDV